MKNISAQEAIRSKSIDTSSLILLSSEVLKKELGESARESLIKINSYYLNGKYVEALEEIMSSASKIKNPEIYNLINSQVELSKKNSIPEHNESRRYFETIFSQKLWNSQNVENFKSSIKLVDMMKQNTQDDSKLKIQLNNISTITSKSENEVAIDCIRSFAELPVIANITSELRSHLYSISNTKDRGGKRNLDGTKPLSYNPGITKANQSMPTDSLLDTVVSGKVTDLFDIDANKLDGYSKNHRQVPYVNSISGTAYDVVATLSKYMELYKNDKNLEKDINNIAQGYLSFACKNGYHSMEEILDVFHSKEAKEIFDRYNVKINPLPESILAESISQATEYSKKINLQSNVNAEIKDMVLKNELNDLSHIKIPKELITPFENVKLDKAKDIKTTSGINKQYPSRSH